MHSDVLTPRKMQVICAVQFSNFICWLHNGDPCQLGVVWQYVCSLNQIQCFNMCAVEPVSAP